MAKVLQAEVEALKSEINKLTPQLWIRLCEQNCGVRKK